MGLGFWEGGEGGEASCLNCISTEGGETQDWLFVFNERKTNSAGRWFPPLKFPEEPLANKTKASGSSNPPCLTPASLEETHHFARLCLSTSLLALSWVWLILLLYIYFYLFIFFFKNPFIYYFLLHISFSVYLDDCLAILFPFPVWAQAGCPPAFPPLGCSVCCGPFVLAPSSPRASAELRAWHMSPYASRGGRLCFSLAWRETCMPVGADHFPMWFYFFFFPPPPLFYYLFIYLFLEIQHTPPTPHETIKIRVMAWRKKKKWTSPPLLYPTPKPRHG